MLLKVVRLYSMVPEFLNLSLYKSFLYVRLNYDFDNMFTVDNRRRSETSCKVADLAHTLVGSRRHGRVTIVKEGNRNSVMLADLLAIQVKLKLLTRSGQSMRTFANAIQ